MDEGTKAAEEFCDAAEALISVSPNPAAAGERAVRCDDCEAAHTRALLREVELRHAAEAERDAYRKAKEENDERFMLERDAARTERDAAIVERDARIADEALRAQRVDVEALRAKVEAMRKNLMAVDARADERHVAALRARDVECEAQVAAVRAEEQAAAAQLAGLRAGDAARVEAIQEAMGAIWAFDRRDRAAATARTEGELRRQLTQILSVAFVLPQ